MNMMHHVLKTSTEKVENEREVEENLPSLWARISCLPCLIMLSSCPCAHLNKFHLNLSMQVVTCGSIPLESSFQRVPRCVYIATELYEYRGLGGKSANPKHRFFSWGCRHAEVDFSPYLWNLN